MDPNTQNSNQSPVSFDSAIDMDAINAAVEASAGQGNNVETSFDVNKINLDNTPTTNDELQKQLEENPGMSLSGSDTATAPAPATTEPVADATAPAAEQTPDMSQHVSVGDDDPFSSPIPAPAKEEEELTIESESKAPGTITINAAKMQENAMKALDAVKPKNSTGVIVLAAIAGVVVLGIIIAILLLI